MTPVRRGDLFLARLDPTVGSEQAGVRPVLVVQSDLANPICFGMENILV